MIIEGVEIKDEYMFDTIRLMLEYSGIEDINTIISVYKELYNKTIIQNKPWDCQMINEILFLRLND